MSMLLELPRGENALMAAYEAMQEGETLPADGDLAALYRKLFTTAVPPASERAPEFTRVSLTDPTIQTVLRGNTSG